MLQTLEEKVFDRLLSGPLGKHVEGCQVKMRILDQNVDAVYETIDKVSERYESMATKLLQRLSTV